MAETIAPQSQRQRSVGLGALSSVDTFLRIDAVKHATGLGRSTIYDLMAEDPPRFPRPVRPGGENAKAVAWLASEVAAWQRQKVAERDGVAA